MSTKLTLNIKKDVIEDAKDYAKENSISLSKLIENYLKALTQKDNNDKKISPLVESLTGIIPEQSDERNREDYYEYLREKYS